MRKSDKTWRPDLPDAPVPPYVWLLTVVFMGVLAVVLILAMRA